MIAGRHVKAHQTYGYEGNRFTVSSVEIDCGELCVWGTLRTPDGQVIRSQTVIRGDANWDVPLTPLPEEAIPRV